MNNNTYDEKEKFPDFNFYIAGVQFHEGKHLVKKGVLEPGIELTLEPEPTNQYDPNAVKILYNDIDNAAEVMLGYVPKRLSASVSAFLETHEKVSCVLEKVSPEKKTWEQLNVTINGE